MTMTIFNCNIGRYFLLEFFKILRGEETNVERGRTYSSLWWNRKFTRRIKFYCFDEAITGVALANETENITLNALQDDGI